MNPNLAYGRYSDTEFEICIQESRGDELKIFSLNDKQVINLLAAIVGHLQARSHMEERSR